MLGGRSIQSPCALGTQRPTGEEQAGCLQEVASRPGSSPLPGSWEKAAHPQLVRERHSLLQGFLGALKTHAMAADLEPELDSTSSEC